MEKLTGIVQGTTARDLADHALDEAIKFFGHENFTLTMGAALAETTYETGEVLGAGHQLTPTHTTYRARYKAEQTPQRGANA